MRYEFRVKDAIDLAPEGADCASLEAARCHAILHAAKVVRDHPSQAQTCDELRIEVMDDGGLLLSTLVILSIDAKDPHETIEVSRRANAKTNPEPMFIIGSGHASRRQGASNK